MKALQSRRARLALCALALSSLACSSSSGGAAQTSPSAGGSAGASAGGGSQNGGTAGVSGVSGTGGSGTSAAMGGSPGAGGSETGGATSTGGSGGSGDAGASTGGSSSGGEPSGGASQGGDGGTGGSGDPTMPSHLPTATGMCPDMSNLKGTAVTFAGQQATVWSGDPAKGPGPLLLYYYATGSSPAEPMATIGQAQIAAITAMGGAVVAQNKTTSQGSTTGNSVWFTGDAAIADEIVACAIANQNVDPRRIHVAGYSAGALQTTYMWFARSGYVASVISYSGGEDVIDKVPFQDPTHAPAAVIAHGAKGVDTYGGVIDFFTASTTWETDTKKAGAFAIDCDDGGNHTNYVLRTKIAPEAVQFLFDHPYGVTPEPYATLPATWPSYCAIQ